MCLVFLWSYSGNSPFYVIHGTTFLLTNVYLTTLSAHTNGCGSTIHNSNYTDFLKLDSSFMLGGAIDDHKSHHLQWFESLKITLLFFFQGSMFKLIWILPASTLLEKWLLKGFFVVQVYGTLALEPSKRVPENPRTLWGISKGSIVYTGNLQRFPRMPQEPFMVPVRTIKGSIMVQVKNLFSTIFF